MFSKKIPLYYLLITMLAGILLTFMVVRYMLPQAGEDEAMAANAACGYKIERLNGYSFVRPILFAEKECESEKYAPLKGDIMNLIDNEKQTGKVTDVSVYLRVFNQGDWIAINADEPYDPGSLLKVAVLITCLKMAEANPAILNQQIKYEGDTRSYPVEHFRADTISQGNTYAVKDLMRAMIVNSDNRATWILDNYMDIKMFGKAFTDLNLKEPHFTDTSYRLTAKDYSIFWKSIYNASYISNASSEYAGNLLSQSVFKQGIAKDIPASVPVAHKFGEFGNGHSFQLHESGIVYLPKSPYLVTIMTKGSDWDEQAHTIASISKLIYEKISAEK